MPSAPAWVAHYVGLPYAKGGRTRDAVDCWGLFALGLRERFGFDIAEYDGPLFEGKHSAGEVGRAAEAFASRFVEIAPGQEREGDAVLFRVLGEPLHIGLVVAPGLFLHVDEQAGFSCVESYRSERYRRRVHAFYRAEYRSEAAA